MIAANRDTDQVRRRGQWRVAFAFDPRRHAVLLIAGDKSGGSEQRFYARLIAKADRRFRAHLQRTAPKRK